MNEQRRRKEHMRWLMFVVFVAWLGLAAACGDSKGPASPTTPAAAGATPTPQGAGPTTTSASPPEPTAATTPTADESALSSYLSQNFGTTSWYGLITRVEIENDIARISIQFDPDVDGVDTPGAICDAVRATTVVRITVVRILDQYGFVLQRCAPS